MRMGEVGDFMSISHTVANFIFQWVMADIKYLNEQSKVLNEYKVTKYKRNIVER